MAYYTLSERIGQEILLVIAAIYATSKLSSANSTSRPVAPRDILAVGIADAANLKRHKSVIVECDLDFEGTCSVRCQLKGFDGVRQWECMRH